MDQPMDNATYWAACHSEWWGCNNIVQDTFREVLTMLSVFDSLFILFTSVSFGMPHISSYWKVKIITNVQQSYQGKMTASNDKMIAKLTSTSHIFFPVLDPPRNLPLDFAHHPDLLERLHLVGGSSGVGEVRHHRQRHGQVVHLEVIYMSISSYWYLVWPEWFR